MPTPPSASTLAELEALYVAEYQVKPVLTAILRHPDFYGGERMVIPPIVHTAGLLRRIGASITTNDWAWIGQLAGQQLFYPPNVAGWDYTRWLDTSTFLGRWTAVTWMLKERALEPRSPAAERAVGPGIPGGQRTCLLAQPPGVARNAEPARAVCRPGSQRRDGRLAEAVLPGADRERAAPARRRLSRPANGMSRRCCDEFSRQAVAGQGLRGIEPGMPVPAGTGMTRRSFFARSLGLAMTVYGVGSLGVFEGGIAEAAAGPKGKILVSVFLPGGADGLSMLYPAADPLYRKLRPSLALSGGAPFTEDQSLAWHPALAPIAQLHDEGKVTVMPAVGYTHPDQSHFTSRHYWEVGATEQDLRTGWLGRYLDEVGTADNPLQGLSLTGQLEPGLATARVPVAAINGPDQYTFYAPGVWNDVQNRMLEAMGEFGNLHTTDAALRTAGAVAQQSERLRIQLLPFAGKKSLGSPVTYPVSTTGQLPKRLAGIAAMIGAGLPMRCVALEADGEYDTHADESSSLQPALDLTATSLLAFQRDLEARGVADRVLTLVWTEFGRRAQENGSGGTDHGAAGTAFLIGSQTSGRMVGEFPGLAHGLDADGNLKPTADFRGVYTSLLEQWLSFDAEKVIPGAGGYGRPRLVRS